MNLESPTAREWLRRELEQVHGAEYQWAATLNTAFSRAIAAFLKRDNAVKVTLKDYQPTDDVFLIKPLVTNSTTIVFGDGGSCKTYITLAMMVMSSWAAIASATAC